MFEYVPVGVYEREGFTKPETAACAPPPFAASEEVVPVSAEVSGLVAGELYEYRLSAVTGGVFGGGSSSGVVGFTVPAAPVVVGSSVSGLSSSSVVFGGVIDPLGAATSYQFQFVTRSAFEADVAAGGDGFGDLSSGGVVPASMEGVGAGGASGSVDASVAGRVEGLAAGTVYEYRLVASNAYGVVSGAACGGRVEAACSFATLPAAQAGLPDGRSYELVTPPDKGDAEDMFAGAMQNNEYHDDAEGYPAEDGEGFLLITEAAFGAFPAAGANAYVFRWGQDGWSYVPLASPGLGVQAIGETLFEPASLGAVAFTDVLGSRVGATPERYLSLAGAPGGGYARLAEVQRSTPAVVAGGSADLSHVVLEGTDHGLCAGAEGQVPGSDVLCESTAGGGLTLVNGNGKGTLVSKCGAMLGLGVKGGLRHDAVSADGERIFFAAPDPYAKGDGSECWNGGTEYAPQLYMRAGGKTVRISKPTESGVSDPCASAVAGSCHYAAFVGASQDGSKVFFMSESQLTKDTVEDGIHDAELYEYDVESGKLTRISAGAPAAPAASAGAQVFAVPAVSADGSSVYFMAFGQLTTGAPVPAAGEVNLYRYDTVTGATTFIATVEAEDYPESALTDWPTFASSHKGEIALQPEANWYATPDGEFLVFSSSSQLTGYSTREAAGARCPRLNAQAPNGHCSEVYRYDAASGQIACVSCNPSGAPPESNAFFARSGAAVDNPAGGPVQAISDDGEYVFFDTADALVAQDKNHTLDVYEWHAGNIALISSGENSAPSFFMGQSAAEIDGQHVEAANVFFGTHAKLVAADADGSGDLYDARIDGGFPPAPRAGSECREGACQSAPAAPLEGSPASLVFQGPGNPAPAKALPGPLSRTQKLARALKQCRRAHRKRGPRMACERQARHKYAAKTSHASARHSGKRKPQGGGSR